MHCFGLCVLPLVMALCQADLFSQDGVLIEEVGETRTVGVVWTMLITINPPRHLPIRPWTERVRRAIESAGRRVSSGDKLAWETRLSVLCLRDVGATLDSTPIHLSRKRRGLLNIGGEISKQLFGTALDSDVEHLRAIVETAARNNVVVFHNMDRLVTVVNQTRKFVHANHLDLEQVKIHEKALQIQLGRQSARLAMLDQRVHSLSISRIIDRTIYELELMCREHQYQIDIYQRQKQELERGWLTEDTLAPVDLMDILSNIRKWGYETPLPEWYYQNLQLEPIWSDQNNIVFTTAIPGLNTVRYLQYHLQYFPVSMNIEHLRIIEGQPEIAMNTESGGTFWPKDCIGRKPKVCVQQKEILTPTCEAGLISNQTLDLCKVRIIKNYDKSSDVYPFAVGRFVVVPYKKLVMTLRCTGKAAKIKTIVRPSIIKVSGNCELETNEWKVSGVQIGLGKLIESPKEREPIVHMNFTWPVKIRQDVMEAFKWSQSIEVPLLDMRDWDKKLEVVSKPPVEVVTYTLGSVIIITIFIMSIGLIYLYCHRRTVSKRVALRTPGMAPEKPGRMNHDPSNPTVIELASLMV